MKQLMTWMTAACVAAFLLPDAALAQGTPYAGPANPAELLDDDPMPALIHSLDPALDRPAAIAVALSATLATDAAQRLAFQKICGLAAPDRPDAYPMGPNTKTCIDAVAAAIADARTAGGGGGGTDDPALGGAIRLDQGKVQTLTLSHCPQGTQGSLELRGSEVWLNCGGGQAEFKIASDLTNCAIVPSGPQAGEFRCNYDATGPAFNPFPQPPPPEEPSFVEAHPVLTIAITAGVTALIVGAAGALCVTGVLCEFETVSNGATP